MYYELRGKAIQESLTILYNMLYYLLMTDLIAISEARANLKYLVARINKNYDRALITVNGQPKAVLLSMEELESLEETAEVLSIPGIKKDLENSRKQIKSGDFVPLEGLE